MNKDLKTIRWLLAFFMISLLVSGLTAIPVEAELKFLLRHLPPGNFANPWLSRVLEAYGQVKTSNPFLLYGYDWLAFAHFILALIFIGPYRDPVKNIWVIAQKDCLPDGYCSTAPLVL